MTDYPTVTPDLIPTGTLSNYSDSCIFGQAVAATGPSAAALAPGANNCYYTPIEVTRICTAYQIVISNGATIAGNFDTGIYDENLVRLVSAGTTAQSGVNGIHVLNITDTLLLPGIYYTGFVSDSATATYRAWNTTVDAVLLQACGVQVQTGTYPLPNPAVFPGGIPAAINNPTVSILFTSPAI